MPAENMTCQFSKYTQPTGINFMTYKSVNKQKFMMKIFFEPRRLWTCPARPSQGNYEESISE